MTQEIGETRQEMTRDLMKRIENIMSEVDREQYYVLVHAKPFPKEPNVIKMKYLIMEHRPSMMLSCMLFKIDNKEGKLTLEWSLPGDWPTWAAEGENEPIPETIASFDRLEKKLELSPGSTFIESPMETELLSRYR